MNARRSDQLMLIDCGHLEVLKDLRQQFLLLGATAVGQQLRLLDRKRVEAKMNAIVAALDFAIKQIA